MQPATARKTQPGICPILGIYIVSADQWSGPMLPRLSGPDASNTQAATTLGATSTDHGAAAFRAHAHEKAVCTLAAYDRRLISAFHDDTPLKKNPQLHNHATDLSSTLFAPAVGNFPQNRIECLTLSAAHDPDGRPKLQK